MKVFAPLLIAVALGISGCGGELPPPPTATASGVVTLAGSPLADADVYFMPDPPVFSPAQAKTDAEGKFTITATVGKNKVGINKADKEVVPAKYRSPMDSGLTADVPAAGVSGLKFEVPAK